MEELDLSRFAELRRTYICSISEGLSEALSLMSRLNSNLQLWAERTGELEQLAVVWATFQSRLASLSSALAAVEGKGGDRQTDTEDSGR